MNELTFSAIWCAGQVAIVALLALAVARWSMSRQPAIAATVSAASLAAVLLMTALIPFSVPRWVRENVNQIAAPTEQSIFTRNLGSPSAGIVNDPRQELSLDLSQLVGRLRNWRTSPPALKRELVLWLELICITGVLFGLARVGRGVWEVGRISRRSIPLDEPQVHDLAKSLQQSLGLDQPVRIAESSEIDCAAVLGFVRPSIVLTDTWRNWSPEELRAVLAHELSHVSRWDSATRLLATLGAAVHFYNPLVHWLTRQLVLAQELSADQLAIQAVGHPQQYLRSLSGLLLRLDAGAGVRPLPLVTPVFASDWIRRIKMLRTMDGTAALPARRWVSLSLAGIIAVLAIASTGLRAIAQTPEPSLPAEPRPVTDIEQSHLFRNPKVSPLQSMIGPKGGVHLDLVALRKAPALGKLLDESLTIPVNFLMPLLDVSAIDSITTDATLTVGYIPGQERPHTIQTGATRAVIRTNRDIDWAATLQQIAAQEELKKDGDTLSIEATIPALGPGPLLFQSQGQRELFLGMRAPVAESTAAPEWAREWTAVSGGVLTAVLHATDLEKQATFGDDPGDEQLRILTREVDVAAIGVDLDPDQPVVEVRARLRCRQADHRDQVQTAMRETVQLADQDLDKDADGTPLSADVIKMYRDAFRSMQMIQTVDSPNVVECRWRFTVPSSVLDGALKDILLEKALIQQAKQEQPAATK